MGATEDDARRRVAADQAERLRGRDHHLVTYDLDEDLAWLRAIELQEEDALVAAEQQLSVHDRDRLRGRAEDPGPAVGVPVRVLVRVVLEPLGADGHVVVAIVRALRRDEPLERLAEVLHEPALALVDENGAGRVGAVDERHAVRDTAALHGALHILGHLDELTALLGDQIVVFEKVLHDRLAPVKSTLLSRLNRRVTYQLG